MKVLKLSRKPSITGKFSRASVARWPTLPVRNKSANDRLESRRSHFCRGPITPWLPYLCPMSEAWNYQSFSAALGFRPTTPNISRALMHIIMAARPATKAVNYFCTCELPLRHPAHRSVHADSTNTGYRLDKASDHSDGRQQRCQDLGRWRYARG